MRITENCARCIWEREKSRCDDEGYLSEIRRILDSRREDDTSPFINYLCSLEYRRRFGKPGRYGAVKKQFNELVMELEDRIRKAIEASEDPVASALLFSRIGNYIDYGALKYVDPQTFLGLFEDAEMTERDRAVYQSFLKECKGAQRFLLITDNCGEIVIDRILLEQLKIRFPNLRFQVLVRGDEIFNDATREDAVAAGMDRIAEIISSGTAIAGTIPDMLSAEGRDALDKADVILAKGQGNYESLTGQGFHIFYLLLCKCDLFMERFQVPMLTGLFLEEKA